MKINRYAKGIALGLILVSTSISFASRQIVDTANVSFKNPIPLEKVVTLIRKQEFKRIILESNFDFNGTNIQDFKVVEKNMEKKDIIFEYIKDRKSLLQDVNSKVFFSKDSLESIENINITGMTLIATMGSIDNLYKNFDLNKVDVIDDYKMQKSLSLPKENINKKMQIFATVTDASSVQVEPMYKYLPIMGTSTIKDSVTSGQRFSLQRMQWNNNLFGSDETYEHKIYLHDYDNKTFLNRPSTAYPGCFPVITYAATTWGSNSKPYLDTRLSENGVSCEDNEISYTIGASHADEIAVGTNHYTYIKTIFGNDSSDKYKLQAQVGFRNPEFCDSTWCAAKYKIYSLIPSWNTNVPGVEPWAFSGISPQEAPEIVLNKNGTGQLLMHITDNTFDDVTTRIERSINGGAWSEYAYFPMFNHAENWIWDINGLQPNTTYCYRLRAKNDIGFSPYSNTACKTT